MYICNQNKQVNTTYLQHQFINKVQNHVRHYLKEIYWKYIWDMTTLSQSWPGNKDNEGVTLHFTELQNWSLTTRYTLVSYSGHTKFDLLVRMLVIEIKKSKKKSVKDIFLLFVSYYH